MSSVKMQPMLLQSLVVTLNAVPMSDRDIGIANLLSISHVSDKPIFTFCGWGSIAGIFLFNNTGFSNRVGIAIVYKHVIFLAHSHDFQLGLCLKTAIMIMFTAHDRVLSLLPLLLCFCDLISLILPQEEVFWETKQTNTIFGLGLSWQPRICTT